MAASDLVRASPRLISILYGAVGVLVAVYTAIGVAIGPSIYTDSGVGILISDSMERGAPFNHILEPDAADLARDGSWFLGFWSPGQYVFPQLFERLGLSLGTSLIAVVTLCTLLGLAGWHRLYRSWGFPPLTVALAVVLIAGSRTFALPFGIYNGGEVLLFGSAPWFLLLLGRWRALSPFQSVGILLAIAGLIFIKLSALVLVLAAVAAIVVYDLWPPSLAKLRRPLAATVIVAVLAVAFHQLWLSHGTTQVTLPSAGVLWADAPLRLVQGCAAAVLGMLSLGDFAQRLFRHLGLAELQSIYMLYLVGAIPSVALMIFMARRLAPTHRDYVRFALAMAFFYIVIMTAILVRNTGMWMEGRFYRPLSLTLLIGTVHAIVISGSALRGAFGALAAASVAYGVASYFVRADYNLHSPLGMRGFRHHNLSHDGLALIRQELAGPFDRATTLVWVTSPEIALELPHVRVIQSGEVPAELAARSYKGRVGKLFVLVPEIMVADGRADIILRTLKDYDPGRWTARSLGDHTLYSQ